VDRSGTMAHGPSRRHRGNRRRRFIRALVNGLTASYPVDRHRIFVTGISTAG
jgi:poly(3-hydroxybutyrate) depolymerase